MVNFDGMADRPSSAAAARPEPSGPVYLDHAATSLMLPEALAAMTEELSQLGNPSSLHNAGRRARRVVEEAREQIAAAYQARPSEVVFTSGGTEADNLAVKGLFWARRAADPARSRVLVTETEHHAVLDSVHWLADHEGASVDWMPVSPTGRLSPAQLREAIERDPASVALTSVMWANNEVGTVQVWSSRNRRPRSSARRSIKWSSSMTTTPRWNSWSTSCNGSLRWTAPRQLALCSRCTPKGRVCVGSLLMKSQRPRWRK